MSWEVVGNRVLIAPLEKKTMTAGGLIIPEQAIEDQTRGIVLGVGPGRHTEKTGVLIEIDLDPGDVVLYSKYGGTTVEIEGEEMLLVDPKDVFLRLGEVES